MHTRQQEAFQLTLPLLKPVSDKKYGKSAGMHCDNWLKSARGEFCANNLWNERIGKG